MWRRRAPDPKDFLELHVAPDGEHWGVTRGPFKVLFFTREAAIAFAFNDVRSTPSVEIYVDDADERLRAHLSQEMTFWI